MIILESVFRLMNCFPNSFINQAGEFVAHREANEYFRIVDCENDLDIKCKVLEWLSRSAFKTNPFEQEEKNKKLHEFMLKGINEFLETSFTQDDMEAIYTYLGNACNHGKTIVFVCGGYDMEYLKRNEL